MVEELSEGAVRMGPGTLYGTINASSRRGSGRPDASFSASASSLVPAGSLSVVAKRPISA